MIGAQARQRSDVMSRLGTSLVAILAVAGLAAGTLSAIGLAMQGAHAASMFELAMSMDE